MFGIPEAQTDLSEVRFLTCGYVLPAHWWTSRQWHTSEAIGSVIKSLFCETAFVRQEFRECNHERRFLCSFRYVSAAQRVPATLPRTTNRPACRRTSPR